jgi:hypothetical protein
MKSDGTKVEDRDTDFDSVQSREVLLSSVQGLKETFSVPQLTPEFQRLFKHVNRSG